MSSRTGATAGAKDGSDALSVFGKISAHFRSFSAVSKRNFASKYAFDSIFQNLPDHLAEVFEIWQHFTNFSLNFRTTFQNFITKAPLAFVCNPLARSTGVFLLAKFRFDTAENEPAKNLLILLILLTLTPNSGPAGPG